MSLIRIVLSVCLLVSATTLTGCQLPGDEDTEAAKAGEPKTGEEELFKGPAGDRAWPSQLKPEGPLNPVAGGRVRVAISGNPAEVFTRDGMLRVFEPVPVQPRVKFATDLKPVRRVFITLFECNNRGELIDEEAISIIDPNRRTLVPNREFDLANPAGCIIWRKQTVDKISFKPGRFYRMTLRVESAREAESLMVLFRVRQDAAPGRPTPGR